MKIFPFEHRILSSPLSTQEAYVRLRKKMDFGLTKRMFFTSYVDPDMLPYKGSIGVDWFKISPATVYGNAPVPVINVKIKASDSGSIIDIRLRPHLFEIILAFICMALPIALAVDLLIENIRAGKIQPHPFFLLVFAGLILLRFYNFRKGVFEPFYNLFEAKKKS